VVEDDEFGLPPDDPEDDLRSFIESDCGDK
jgi:hypothetical protein